jgi:hypothetical protein
MSHPLLRAALPSALTLILGCGGAPPAKAPNPPPAAKSAAESAAAKAPPPVPSGHLARREVDRVLTRFGPPWLLRRVMPEEVFDKAGKFAGWRVTGLPQEWSAFDLRPGDVVSRVNGLPLETPDDAWEAWKSVAKAPQIRISLDRDGAARELVIPIDGAPSPEARDALEKSAPPARPPESPRRGVVRIGGDGGDEPESY